MDYNRIVIRDRMFILDDHNNMLIDVADAERSIAFNRIKNFEGDLAFSYDCERGKIYEYHRANGLDHVYIPLRDLQTGFKDLFVQYTYNNSLGFILLDEAYDRRIKGELPVLELYDDYFQVDAEEHSLVNDRTGYDLSLFNAEWIVENGRASYQGYYHVLSRDLVAVDENITELPKNTVFVKFPAMQSLDPVGAAYLDQEQPYSNLFKFPIRRHTAEIQLLEKSPLMKRIAENRERERQQQLQKTKRRRIYKKGK